MKLEDDWKEGIKGVSAGVASVISDYTIKMPPILNTFDQIQKIIQLNGSPWDKNADLDKQIDETEKINKSMIGVLANSGYKLSMPINLRNCSQVYFFIYDPEETNDQVKVPTFLRSNNDTVSVCQSMVTKSKKSFYNSSMKKKIRASLRRKTINRAGRLSIAEGGPAWWQQSSIDMGEKFNE